MADDCFHVTSRDSATHETAASRPVLEMSRSKIPNVWDNMYYAINNMGKPSTLNRITDKALIRKNRVEAGCAAYGSRPAGYNIDEYPFACCAQGGKGAVLRPVPIKENNRQGGKLAQFFKKYDIKDGDSFKIKLIRARSSYRVV
ncbi:uncharacterized protein LOC114528873 [Dendronephthya gigantea]|uniref:uncharacterized protein LOC114528873 n=1 Tax=Dendronephthya gigantea TaxID=151771 RepID=UPI00106C31C8|nr:uncharacterized protein LOC114528873 [Dendronephthya gigantea]